MSIIAALGRPRFSVETMDEVLVAIEDRGEGEDEVEEEGAADF